MAKIDPTTLKYIKKNIFKFFLLKINHQYYISPVSKSKHSEKIYLRFFLFFFDNF